LNIAEEVDMDFLSRLIKCLGLVVTLSMSGLGQSAVSTRPAGDGGARIAGIVSVDGKPASGIVLMLYSRNNGNGSINSSTNGGLGEVKARAITDSQGSYAFNDLSAAKYTVVPFGPTLAAPSGNPVMMESGKSMSVNAGELLDGMDFAMSRGAVITGRITRSNGQPSVESSVIIVASNDSGEVVDMDGAEFRGSATTDDRGIYRFYAMPAGRYAVCAQAPQQALISPSATVCYSTIADKTGRSMITIGAGEDIANVDITLGNPPPMYEAAGRAVDDSGKAVAGAIYYSYLVSDEGEMAGSFMITGDDRTDRDGQFRISGLAPGRYAVSLSFDDQSGAYSDPANFVVADGNVTGIQVKVHSGAAIAGVVAIEGYEDPQVLAQLPNVEFQAHSNTVNPFPLFFFPTSITPSPDGSFQATGFTPGNVTFSINQGVSPKGFSLARVERDGVPQPAGISVSAGQQVGGVRLILVYGTATIRGQVTVERGSLPDGSQIMVGAQPIPDTSPGRTNYVLADARGRLKIDGLSDGQYQMVVRYGISGWQTQLKQVVTVSGGQAPDVQLILDLSK
jgi:protocatechuate 3,4-dioxygenase beta subunit